MHKKTFVEKMLKEGQVCESQARFIIKEIDENIATLKNKFTERV